MFLAKCTVAPSGSMTPGTDTLTAVGTPAPRGVPAGTLPHEAHHLPRDRAPARRGGGLTELGDHPATRVGQRHADVAAADVHAIPMPARSATSYSEPPTARGADPLADVCHQVQAG